MRTIFQSIIDRYTTRARLSRHISAVTAVGPWVLRAANGKTLVIRNGDQLRVERRVRSGMVLIAANDEVCELPTSNFLAKELARALTPRNPVKTTLKVAALGLGTLFVLSLVDGYKRVSATAQSAMATRSPAQPAPAGDFRPVLPLPQSTTSSPPAKLPLPADLAEKIAK